MQTHLTLTILLILILLAAIIAAGAIFFLLARSGPPGDTEAPSPAPPSADVYLNGALLYEQVTHFQVTVPMDGSVEIRVAAPGYKPWGIRPRGGGSDKVMRGPVQLVRE